MRNAEEMYRLILNYAKQDENIRVVGLNGSRCNPEVVPDQFQDFDIVYLVKDASVYEEDATWVDYFGERLIMQMPETSSIFPSEYPNSIVYLMQFTDGNRIDLTIRSMDELNEYIKEDTLTKILLDKDNIAPVLPEPNASGHYTKPPSLDNYLDCCNEFYWVANYVAKGLSRNQFFYAVQHMHNCVIHELLRMIGWAAGTKNDFQVNVGQSYKFLEQYLTEKQQRELYNVYQMGTISQVWQALFKCFELMEYYSSILQEYYEYPVYEEKEKVEKYIEAMYQQYGY